MLKRKKKQSHIKSPIKSTIIRKKKNGRQKQEQYKENKQKKVNMVDINPALSVITLSNNDTNVSTKKQRLSEQTKEEDHLYGFYKKLP